MRVTILQSNKPNCDHGRLRTRETSDTGDFGYYTQLGAVAFNHELDRINMYTNTIHYPCKRLKMLDELM